ncbi:Bug family tripartite tricarboxylate transporter substrate binding protein [Nesterenkonia sphaerica]|uniref:Tripartite tricarboxylate transporter substrate binding protein n=1 Tax=Nesterenkonia sphaerica TaxID=1804988 RepID=A0A5R9A0B3_9MICC|nr:tripartite tricarboxylate transporter substrate binding protein [Nesterenkonia sphaerica]TLP71216.1 tripartite tricarboxylate transporter substrate binding protein [Nesterenkonia sphaerica]
MFTSRKVYGVVSVACISALGLSACDDQEQESEAAGACSILEDEQVTIVVPYDPGGGYDSFARLIAPELEESIGAQVVVENRPGAGGLAAVNEITNAPEDGSRVAIMDGPGVAAASLAGAEGANFELSDLSYIGTVSNYPIVIATGPESDIESLEDLQTAEQVSFASAGRGASDYITAALLADMYDLEDSEIVTGFGGQAEAELSVVQGNVDVIAGVLDSRLPSIQSGDLVPIATIAPERPEDLPDVPLVQEDENLTGDQLDLLDTHQQIHDIGRPLVGPSSMEEEPLDCLRGALSEVADDEEFTDRASDQGRLISHIDGETMEADLTITRDDISEEYQSILEESF